jgi:hypothetical protein
VPAAGTAQPISGTWWAGPIKTTRRIRSAAALSRAYTGAAKQPEYRRPACGTTYARAGPASVRDPSTTPWRSPSTIAVRVSGRSG